MPSKKVIFTKELNLSAVLAGKFRQEWKDWIDRMLRISWLALFISD
jgi:hypothetical protein